MSIAAIIVAAGRGTRAASGHSELPKQYQSIGGKPLLTHTVSALMKIDAISRVVVAIHPADRAHYDACVPVAIGKLMPPVAGGATRQASVSAALEALADQPVNLVLIHDAARPFVDSPLIGRVAEALASHDAVIPGIPVTDTLKRTDAHGGIIDTVPRKGLWRAQTPQGFRFAPILAAHRAAAAAGRHDFTDDAALAEWHGLQVHVVMGSERNRKLTTAEDLQMADRDLRTTAMREVRAGQGFDVHRFTSGDHLWLCGVRIPHTHALDGHSDADVGLHALTDALLGAIGDGDIGQHFPPSDMRWKGAASHIFLAEAARRVAAQDGRITNVDVTLLCEAPRIGPHRDAMRAEIARILRIDISRVGVKATTTEQLGFTGRREGIAAMAIATITLPQGT